MSCLFRRMKSMLAKTAIVTLTFTTEMSSTSYLGNCRTSRKAGLLSKAIDRRTPRKECQYRAGRRSVRFAAVSPISTLASQFVMPTAGMQPALCLTAKCQGRAERRMFQRNGILKVIKSRRRNVKGQPFSTSSRCPVRRLHAVNLLTPPLAGDVECQRRIASGLQVHELEWSSNASHGQKEIFNTK